jgi:SAM-dependent methyltransferase
LSRADHHDAADQKAPFAGDIRDRRPPIRRGMTIICGARLRAALGSSTMPAQGACERSRSMDEAVRRALAPTMEEIRREPASSNARVASELLGEGGGAALDIGCGEGKFTRALAGLFGRVSGVDVKPASIAKAVAAAR